MWTHLPQGYYKSPSIFSQILLSHLHSVAFPQGSTLIQYVNDRLLCNQTKQAALIYSFTLLKALAEQDHKFSRTKLQWVQTTHKLRTGDISGHSKLTQKCIESILCIPIPKMKKQLHKFLRATSCCHQLLTLLPLLCPPPRHYSRAHFLTFKGINLL